MPSARIIAQILILLVAPITNYASALDTTPVPDWVVDRRLKSLSTDMAEVKDRHVDILVQDQQIRFHPVDMAGFTHSALRANSIQGVRQISAIQIPYLPAYQEIAFHYVRIHRNDETMDRSQSVEVRYTRQDAAEPDEMDELMTVATVLIPAVEVGDIVEYAVSNIGTHPGFAGVYSGSFAHGLFPVGEVYQRFLVPRDSPMDVKLYQGHPVASRSRRGKFDEYVWDLGETGKADLEDNMPYWYVPVPTVEFSNQANWGLVADWGREKFDMAADRDDTVQALADRIVSGMDEQEAQLRAVLRYVQSNVRYVGPGLGRNGYRPYSPATIVERLYGDCKDQAKLLQALLAAIGIESWPALVNSVGGKSVSERLPSPLLFDHVVLHTSTDGVDYWLDPTREPSDVDAEALRPVYQFGKALVLRPGEVGLREIPRPDNDPFPLHNRYVSEFDLSGDITDAVDMTIQWHLQGARAAYFRQAHEAMDEKAFEDVVRNDDFPNILRPEIVSSPILVETKESSELTVETRYRVPGMLSFAFDYLPSDYTFVYGNLKLIRSLPSAPDGDRDAPFALPFPYRIEEVLTLTLGNRFFLSQISEFTVENDYFSYAQVPSWDGERYSLHYSYQTKKDHVDPVGYERFRKDLEAILRRYMLAIAGSTNPWSEVDTDYGDVERGMALADIADIFNRENDELDIAVGEPPVTADEISRAIEAWDRAKIAAPDVVYDVFSAVAELQTVPDAMGLLSQTQSPDIRGGLRKVWWVDLCLGLGQFRSFCLPVRRD